MRRERRRGRKKNGVGEKCSGEMEIEKRGVEKEDTSNNIAAQTKVRICWKAFTITEKL